MLIIHRAFARLPSRNNFLPCSILLFPKIPCPLFLPFSASSLPLHLYYPLNNSLCVESDFRCLPPLPPSREGRSLRGAGSWQRLFCASALSLSLFFFFLPFPLLSRDSAAFSSRWRCAGSQSSHAWSAANRHVPRACTSFSDCTYMTAVPVVLSVTLTPTPSYSAGGLTLQLSFGRLQTTGATTWNNTWMLCFHESLQWLHNKAPSIFFFFFSARLSFLSGFSSYIIQYLLYTHKNMALPYFLCCQEICRILLWPCMIHFFRVSSPRPTSRRNQLTVTCGKLLWEKFRQQRMWRKEKKKKNVPQRTVCKAVVSGLFLTPKIPQLFIKRHV